MSTITATPRAGARAVGDSAVARVATGLAGPLAAAAVLYAAFVVRAGFRADGRWYSSLFDDAMISMQYARNLAEGHGLVWNAGGPEVEGYSNLGWTLWMAVVHLAGVPDRLTSLVVALSGLVLLLATVVLVRRIAAELAPGNGVVAATATWGTVLAYPLAYWTLRGMEVGAIAFLATAAVLTALRLAGGQPATGAPAGGSAAETPAGGSLPATRSTAGGRVVLLGALLAAGALVRDDFLVIAVAVAVFAVTSVPREARLRVALVLGGALIGAVGAHLAFRLAYYGEPVPNTYTLKVEGVPLDVRLERGLKSVAYLSTSLLYAPLLAAAAAFALRPRRLPRGAWLLGALVVLQLAYGAYVGGDAWEGLRIANRYVAPVLPLLMVLAGLGLHALAGARGARRRRAAAALALAWAGAVAAVWSDRLASIDLEMLERSDGLAIALALASGAAVLAVAAARRPRGALVAAAAALVVAAAYLPGWRTWAQHNAPDRGLAAGWTQLGLDVGAATTPGATVAVTPAGSVVYFARRPAIDLLGRSDAHVARTPSRGQPFRPGHSKWDYERSIGAARPDVVVALWQPSPRDLSNMRAWGYVPVGRDTWARRGSPRVDPGSL